MKTSKSPLASPDTVSVSDGRTAESSPQLAASSPTNSASSYESSSSEEDEAECCGEWRKCGALRRLMKCCCHPGQTATDLIMGGRPSKCADSRSYECCCGAIDRPAVALAQIEREEVQAVVADADVAVEAY